MIQVTERDKKIIDWINRYKFARVTDVMKKFSIAKSIAYRRLSGLTADGYLKHERIFHGEPGVYFPTKKGWDLLAEGTVGQIQEVSVGTYKHDLTVLEIATKLELEGNQTISEREMRQAWAMRDDQGRLHVPKHVPDLAVILENEKRIYYEIELTSKDSKRLKKILEWYSNQKNIQKVIYYTATNELASRINDLAKKAYIEDILIAERREFYE